MGTELYQRTRIATGRSLDELALTAPDLVRSVHLDYIRAGSELIEANSFGANRFRLADHGTEDQLAEINEAAVRVASEARNLTGQRVWIAGVVGPLGRPIAPLGPISQSQARSAFEEQVEALAGAGVDVVSLQTFTDISELAVAVNAARNVCTLPVIAHVAFNEDERTTAGVSPSEAVEVLRDLQVEAIGTNCRIGSEPMQRIAQEMVGAASGLPVSAQPNAGFPTYRDGRLLFLSSPEYVAEHARRMVEAGVRLIGGCCGTSPDHIAAIRDALRGVGPVPSAQRPDPVRAAARPRIEARAPRALEPTGLAKKLAGKRFAVTVEVDPPKGFDVSPHLQSLSALRDSGLVDAFNVADSPRSRSSMSALAMCSLIQSRLGMETVIHMALRHRNLVALNSDLLGAHALGIRNVFVVLGDLPSTGDHPDATSISDITPTGAIKLIKAFNSGRDLSDRAIEQPTSFVVGCAFNPGADDLDKELRVLDRKTRAGADFILTQPVYDRETIELVRHRLGGFPLPVLMGVLPLRSLRHAEFLHNEVPGMAIPEAARDALRVAGNDAAEVGLEQSRRLLADVHEIVSGAYIIPPFGRYSIALELLDGVKDALGLGVHVETESG